MNFNDTEYKQNTKLIPVTNFPSSSSSKALFEKITRENFSPKYYFKMPN
jgi:hypothetical protein